MIKEELHISIVQPEIRWNDIGTNLQHIEELLTEVSNSDLIILPEMFATGLTVCAPTTDDAQSVLPWMKRLSARKQCVVTGSISIMENSKRYNRLCWVLPDGTVGYYDKRHLFPKSTEPQYFEPGDKREIFQYKGWRICPQICYDLRFPVWSRNWYHEGKFGYDILLYVANWPAIRSQAWNTLLRARAIENQVYVAACNCIGKDPTHCDYHGESQIITPEGNILCKAEGHHAQVIQRTLSWQSLERYRERFCFAEDWD